jgi:hypothetical protein
MATKSVTAKDKRIVNEMASTISRTSGAERDQIISITDLISEGEIEGLVQGESSIYLNDDNIVEPSQSSINSSYLQNSVLTATNGATTGTINKELSMDLSNEAVYRVAYIEGAYVSAVTVGAVATNPRAELTIPVIPLTTSSAFFNAEEMNWVNLMGVASATLKIVSTGVEIQGRLDISSTTQASFNPTVLDPNIANRFVAAAQGEAVSISIRGVVNIISISSAVGISTVTFEEPFPYASGNYSLRISGPRTNNPNDLSTWTNFSKFKGITAQERRGKAEQPPITNFGDVSGTALTSTTFQAQPLEYNDSSSENPTNPPEKPVVISATSSSSTGLGLNAAQVREVDEVRLLFTYSSLKNNKAESGADGGAGVKTKIELTIFRGTEESTVTLVNARNHSGNTTSPVSFEERINLEPFKPFTDFKITVTRLTRQDGRGVNQDGTNKKTEWEVTAPGALTSVTSIIKENLSYPYSAYVNLTFSSKEFQSVPTRTYHVRGLKVRVPSNYTTREENGTNLATYSGLWDGSLDKIVYTDNPAWIFYDILSNNRYGLGEWISVNDIDKYSLYRIAKYCDELVPDGKGGEEPRFRSNIYLTKSTDAYKVLKDMASSFLSMLYWMDGQIVTVIDQAKDPIYTFSKGNVIDGAFSYETTGSKTRANQIIVTWNNPVNNYALEPLIVEDRENIVETGRIITEDAAAFGCTSEGQALRYGRWKLWTAVNQTRIVSFNTSINAAFLTPGDIIKIQDADEYNIAYSGRVSNSGTLDTNTIPLDRTVTLNAGSTYYLSVLLEQPTVANEGEEEKTDTKVETIQVTSTGAVSSLELASAFSSIPPRSSVWVLQEETPLGTSETSAKDYKILAITENEKNNFSITAVEHYNEKFDAVDQSFSLVVERGVEPNYAALETPPPPASIYIQGSPDFNKPGNEFRLTWDSPKNPDGSLYSFVSGFEISHNVPGYDSPLILPASPSSFLFENVEEATYSIAIRTLNSTGKKSTATTGTFFAENQFESSIPRGAGGIPTSGATSTPLIIDQSGLLRFKEEPFSFIFPQDGGQATNFASANKINTYDTALVLNTGYDVTFNHNGVLAVLGKETSGGLILWYDALNASSNWTLAVQNITRQYSQFGGANTITLFIEHTLLEEGESVKIEDSNNSSLVFYAKVASATSYSYTYGQVVFTSYTYTLDRAIPAEGYTVFNVYKSASKEYVDPTLSTFVGKLTRTGSSSSTFIPLITPDPLQVDLPPTTVRLSSSDYKIVYNESSVNPTYIDETGTEITGVGNILLTADALNIDTPLYRFTLEGQVQPWTESPTVSIPVPQTFFNNAKVYKVEVAKKPTGWTGDGVVADPYVAASYDEISITPTTKLGYTPYNITNPANYATETYVNTSISNLVDSAPATLDTLNELAAALGDDENFATTVTDAIALKAPIASPSFTGDVTVAGLVDGRDIAADGTKLDGIEAGATADQTAAEIRALVESATDSNVFTNADHSKLDGIEAGATADQTGQEIKDLIEDNLTLTSSQISDFSTAVANVAAVKSVAGLTGDITVANLEAEGLFLTSKAGPLATFAATGVPTASISTGKIVLSSGSLDFTTGTPTKNNTVVLDTTADNNAISVYEGTVLRVKIGKLS